MAPAIEPFERQVRAGGRVLQLLSDTLDVSILRQLTHGPVPTPDLPSRLSPASRTTRFTRLRELEDLGVISREKRAGSPPVTYCMLSPAGVDLLRVAKRFAGWLSQGSAAGNGHGRVAEVLAIKALAAGWGTGVLHWLAERPHTVTELSTRGAPQVSYHDVRRARHALAEATLIEPAPSEDRGKPYTPTEWVRQAAGPLAAAVRWEREALNGAGDGMTTGDVEALLLLAARLVKTLPGGCTGSCALLFESGGGVSVAVEGGRIVACAPYTGERGRCHVRGPASAWLDALLDGCVDELEMHGAIRLATALTGALHEACL